MMFRIARASLAVLAVFNVASSLASPETVSSAWAQHARRIPQNPARPVPQLACIAAPRPRSALRATGPGLTTRRPLAAPTPRALPHPSVCG